MTPDFYLKRDLITNKGIIGIFSNDKGLKIAETFEPPHFDNIEGSCIPYGRYKCVKDNTGKHRHWKILNVPNKVNVEFHVGNYLTDTDACILLGQERAFLRNKETNKIELAVISSVNTFKKIKEQRLVPDEFWLNVIS